MFFFYSLTKHAVIYIQLIFTKKYNYIKLLPKDDDIITQLKFPETDKRKGMSQPN